MIIQNNQSTQLRNPIPDQTDEGLRVYCAALERRLILMTLRDIKLRTVCELATGQPYDSYDPADLTFDEIMEQVAQDMSRGLNLSIQEARSRVAHNRKLSTPTQAESATPVLPDAQG
jgi:hypothetical protein